MADETPSKLSEQDIDRIVEAMEERFAKKFFESLGEGLWGLVKKGLVLVFAGLAFYGMSKGK